MKNIINSRLLSLILLSIIMISGCGGNGSNLNPAAAGDRPPAQFTVDETPAPVFYNFIVPDNEAAALAAALPLPSGFTLQKIRILESDPAEVIISDTTPFADFIDSVPKHILVFMDKIEFVISPWYNLNEL